MPQILSDNLETNAPKVLDNKNGRFSAGKWRPYNDVAEYLAEYPVLASRAWTQQICVLNPDDATKADIYMLDKNKIPQLVITATSIASLTQRVDGLESDLTDEVTRAVLSEQGLQTQINNKADQSSITEPVLITFANIAGNTYTNLSFANQTPILQWDDGNGTFNQTELTFNSSGVATLPFTATSGFKGTILAATGSGSQYAKTTDVYEYTDPSNLISAVDNSSAAVGVLSGINRVEIDDDGYLQIIQGKFSGAGNMILDVLENRQLVSPNLYSFDLVAEYTVPIPGSGSRTIDVSSLLIKVEKTNYIGVNKTSTAGPVFGTDAAKGYGWYQKNTNITTGTNFLNIPVNPTDAQAGWAFNFTIKKTIFADSDNVYSKDEVDSLLYSTKVSNEMPTLLGDAKVMQINDVAENRECVVTEITTNIPSISGTTGKATFQVVKRVTFDNTDKTPSQSDTFEAVKDIVDGEEVLRTVTLDVLAGLQTYKLTTPLPMSKGHYLAWASKVGDPGASFSALNSEGFVGAWQGVSGSIADTLNLAYQPRTAGYKYTTYGAIYEQAGEGGTTPDQPVVINKITAERNSINYNSVRDIISGITDANDYNKYHILVGDDAPWPEFDIQGKPNVKIIGTGRTLFTIDGTSTNPDWVAPSDFSYPDDAGKQIATISKNRRHIFFAISNLDIEGVNAYAISCKYVAHLDKSSIQSVTMKNMRLKEKDCLHVVGSGVYAGQSFLLDGITFERTAKDTTIFEDQDCVYIHNAPTQTGDSSFIISNSKFENGGYLRLGELGSGRNDNIGLINCENNGVGSVSFEVDQGSWGSDPQTVPYCIKLNTSGTKVDLITSRKRFSSGTIVERPDMLSNTISDYYGIAVNDNSQVIEAGDVLCKKINTTQVDKYMRVVKKADVTTDLEIVGTAWEANQINPGSPVALTTFKFIPKGKIAPLKVSGAVALNSGLKLKFTGLDLLTAPTTPIKECDAMAFTSKTAPETTVLAKLL